MILAAGFTPAWQQIMVFDQFLPGEVNRAREVHWCGSGKVLNAGLALHHLGGPSLTLSPIGGPAREAIEHEFNELGVPCRWIESRMPTRVCTTLLDRGNGTTTELVENARPVPEEEVEAFRKAFAQAVLGADLVVLTGSLPSGMPSEIFQELMELTVGPVILDIRGDELLAALASRPMLVKPNREELSRTVGRDLSDDRDLQAAMRSLNDRGAEWVVVTQGAQPVWATHEGQVYRLVPPPAESVVNPIACGDSMAAGIAWALRGGQEPLDAIRFGIGAAIANLAQLLPARIDPDEAARLAELVRVD